jgi:hypothetical protein
MQNRKKYALVKLKQIKQFALTAIIILAASTLSNAQSLSFGPKIGYSFTTLKGNDVPDGTDPLSGLVGGVFFKYAGESGIFAFQPEILYHQKGAVDMEDGSGIKLNVDYLEVPLLFKVQIPVGETFFPHVYAGPYGAFELNNNLRTQASIFGFTLTNDGNADVQDFDYGAIVGAGFDVQLEAFYLGFDARYGIGMERIVSFDGDRQDIKNRNFSLMLGLGVNIGE